MPSVLDPAVLTEPFFAFRRRLLQTHTIEVEPLDFTALVCRMRSFFLIRVDLDDIQSKRR